MSFQRSGKTPSPEGYRNLGKSRSCQHSGILQDCFHRAGALESLQRFALQNDSKKTKRKRCYEVPPVKCRGAFFRPSFSFSLASVLMGNKREGICEQRRTASSFRFPALAILLYVDQVALPTGQCFAASPAVSKRESWLTPRRRAFAQMTRTFSPARSLHLVHKLTTRVPLLFLPCLLFAMRSKHRPPVYPCCGRPPPPPAHRRPKCSVNMPHTKHANSRATAVTATFRFTPR